MMRRRFLALALASPFAGLIPKAKVAPTMPRAVIDNIPLLMRAFGFEDMQYTAISHLYQAGYFTEKQIARLDQFLPPESRPC